jgi:geranylgeranylglycerol-phosphate geranylgeranyltransferase
MIGTWTKVGSQLTRLDTSAIAFLSLLVPLYNLTNSWRYAVAHSLPLLTISMSGFVINDLHDLEKDKTNHPQRPLPSETISPVAASILYFFLLALSLMLIKASIEPHNTYLYLLLLLALINYNYVVSYIPWLKDLYVATIGVFPLFILSSLAQTGVGTAGIIISLFLFLVGRELLMDIEDFDGDGETLVKKLGLVASEHVAFAFKFTGSLVLLLQVKDLWGTIIWFLVAGSDLLSYFIWTRAELRTAILFIMKLQLLAGIYYLL